MTEQSLRLLLIDDEISVREPLAKHLRKVYHYRVDTAADAESALKQLVEARGQYEVALIDDMLAPKPGQEPESLGASLTKEIKEHYPGIEIIIFTGWGMESGLEALRAGAYRYLAKPFNLEELGMLIQTAAEHSRLMNAVREKQILEQLMETSTALLSESSLREVLDTILHGVQAIGFDRVRLYLLSEERQVMLGHAQVGMEEEFVGFEFPVADNIHTKILLKENRPQVFERKNDELWPYEERLNKADVDQWLGVPLWLHGKFIGMLSADNKFSQRPISREELRPVALFAAQAAAAIENARLRDKEREATQQAEQRARNLKAVQEVSTNISSLMELDKILESTCRAAVELFDVDHSGLVRFEEQGYKRGWVVAEYPDFGTRGTEIPVQGIPAEEQLISSKEPLVLADISDEIQLGPVRDILNKFNIHSILIVPMVIKEQIIGSFSLDGIGRSRTFSEEEVELCKIFAAQVAVAIENSRSLKKIQRYNEQLESLNQITAQINSALDLDGVLRIALKEGLQAVKASAGTIMLINPLTDKFEIRARGVEDKVEIEQVDWKWQIGDGIVGHVTQTGQAYNCADITKDAHFVGPLPGRNFRSLLSVPITSYDRVLGAINVKGRDAHFFRQDNVQVLATLSNHIAIALESQRLRDLDQILSTLPLDEMLLKVVECACTLIGTGFGSIFLIHGETGEVVRAASVPVGRKIVDGPRKHGGLTDRIKSSGEPIIINDAQGDTRVRPSTKARGIKSLVGVPLKVRGEQDKLSQVKTIGVLFVDSMQQRIFNNRDVELLQSLANQAATAIEKTRLYEIATRERDRSECLASQLLALTEITQEIQAELALPNLLDLISRLAVELLKADAGGILLLDEEKQHLTFKGTFGLSQKVVDGTRDVVGSSIAGRVVEMGKPIIAHDIPNHPHFYNPTADGEGWLAILSTPLQVGSKIIGTLDVHHKHDPHAFSEGDLRILSLMANQAAIAIEHARLFQETSQRALALEALHRTSLDITSRRPMPELVKTILDRAVELLQAKGGCLYQLDEPGKLLRVVAVSSRPDLKIGMTRKLQNDVVGRVIKTRKSLSVSDYKNWPDREHQNDRYAFSTVASAPVAWEDKIWGAIAVHDEVEGRVFGEEELDLLSHLGNLAAVALANTDLMTKDEEKLRRLEKLARVNSEIVSNLATMSLDKRLNLITRYATEILAAETGAIFLVKRPGILCLEASYGHRAGFFEKGREFAIQSGPRTGLTGHIAYEGKPFRAHGDDLTNHFAAARGSYQGASADLYSTLAIPLKQTNQSEERLIGLLRVNNKKNREAQPGPLVGFTQEDEWILSLFADAVVVAIQGAELIAQLTEQKDNLVRLHEITDRHRQLLLALDEASRRIRAEKETFKLLQDVVRLAAELARCTAGGLYINRPQLQELELQITYALPSQLIRNRLSHSEGLVGLVARTGQPQVVYNYSDWPERENILEAYHFKTVIGIPLKQAGEVEAVLFVANQVELRPFAQADLEILESFAVQASIALQTSRLLNREQRMFRPLAILHKVSDYIQAARDLDKILHVVLTGITAGYGLGFNRATLLLLDERREYLIGRMGIGYLDEPAALEDWASHCQRGLEDFGQYLTLLEEDSLSLTPVGERIRQLQIPIRSEEPDILSQSVSEGKCVLITQDELDKLPSSFIEMFEPDLPFIIVPLLARNQVIGLVVADNKFTHYPITPEDIELLLTFANTAAVAIDNIRLFRETEAARARLRSFYEASNALVSSREPEQVLQDIVEQTRLSAQATGVSILLIDQIGQARYLITGGRDKQVDIEGLIRPNGLSRQVMRTGRPEAIEDANIEQARVNPNVFSRGIVAALCLPFSVEGGRIGVMWLHYDQPRHFAESEIEALQLYVNQAALAYDGACRIKDLEHLRQAAEALAGAANPQEVLERIVQSASEVMQADSTVIWSYDAVRDQFILDRSFAVGIPSESWEKFQKISPRRGGIAYKVMEQGWIGVTDIDDVRQYEFLSGSTPKLLRQVDVRSFQGIALTVDDEKLAVLYVNYNRRRSFSEEEQKTAQIFANNAALVLRNARLQNQVSKARNAARVVAEVTALENLQSTLQSIVRGTRDVLDCDVVTLYTYNQDRSEVGFPPVMVGVNYPEKVLELGTVAKQSIIYDILARNDSFDVEHPVTGSLLNTPFARREGIISSKGFSLTTGDRKVGIMFVNYRSAHRFTTDELTTIELFSNQAAVAIRNAQLFEHVQKRTRALETLYEAGRAVTSSLDLEEILWAIAEQACRLIDTSRFSNLALLAENNMKSVAAYPKEHFAGIQKVIDNIDLNGPEPIGLMGRVAKTGQAYLSSDTTREIDYIKYDEDTLSELAVPIKRSAEIMGVINVEASGSNAFDVEDQRTLESLAAQAAVAIENARLFGQTQRRTRLLDAAAQVARSATAILDIDKLLQETVHLIPERFDCYHAAVFLLDNEGEYTILRASYPENDQRLLKPDHKLRVGHEGIVGFVAHTGKAHFASDVSKDPYYIANLPPTQAELAFPLIVRGQVIGVLDVQSTQTGDWQSEDIATLQTMADQLANAIHNAQLYQQLAERLKEANTLQLVAGSLAGALELHQVLELIMSGAMKLTNTPGISVLLWDTELEKFTQAFRIDEGGTLYPYEIKARPKGGLARRIMIERKSVAISDARQVPDLNPAFLEQGYCSSLGTPLICQNEVIGVLYVHDRVPREFPDRQKIFLETLASQAAVAIDRAHRYEELKRTKGLVGARTAVAWMGMVSSIWRHAIQGHAVTIQREVANLRATFPEYSDRINEKLVRIDKLARLIMEKPITAPLSEEDGVGSVPINSFTEERFRLLWGSEPYASIPLRQEFKLNETITVRASRDWLTQVFDTLVDNAIEAMVDVANPVLTVSTAIVGQQVEIIFTDTGRGIPENILPRLFHEQIEKPTGVKGLGMGLLMAHTIVQTYGGEIRVKHTGSTGTSIAIALPIES